MGKPLRILLKKHVNLINQCHSSEINLHVRNNEDPNKGVAVRVKKKGKIQESYL